MTVTLVTRAVPVRAVATVALAAGLVLVAGIAGLAQPLVAVAVAAAGAAAVPGVALVCLGIAVKVTVRAPGACQCAGMLGLGTLAGGLAAASLPLLGPAGQQPVAAAGLVVAAGMFVWGVLQVPGVLAGMRARVRLVLDGLTIGLLLALAGWLLVPGLTPLAYASTMIAVTCAAIIGAIVVCTGRQRQATAWCGIGAMLAVLGLALVVATVGTGTASWVVLAAAGLAVAGPPLMWAGARRIGFSPPAGSAAGGGDPAGDASSGIAGGDPSGGDPSGGGERIAGHPMLALPVAVAVLATAYHLATVGPPDRTAVLLSMAAGTSLAVREVLAASDLRARTRRLAAREAHLRALVAGAGDATVLLSTDQPGGEPVVGWLSPAAGQFGLGAHAMGRRFRDLVHPEDAAAVSGQLAAVHAGAGGGPVLIEARLAVDGGGWRETESAVTDLRAVPEVGALVLQVRDVAQRRHLERAARLLASTDQRTGLPNRAELLRAAATRGSGGRPRGALVVLGLQGLTEINDCRGRAAGDAALVEVARRLRAHAGAEDVVARLGGGRFAVLAGHGPIEAYALAVRLVGALAVPYQLPEGRVQLAASAGLAAFAPGDRGEEVLHRANVALRRACQLGRDQVEWYDESLEEQLVRRLDLERHLPGAAGRGELDLVYQPVVALAGVGPEGNRAVGVEALLRWRHPVLGRVPPAELMPVADQLGISGEIGEWVLHTACRQAAAWRRDGYDLWLALNVSAAQLTGTGFVPGLAAALSVHQTPPERLLVEIAEAEVAADLPAVASQLGKVRGLGVRTALDGLGAGDSELAWLRRLPLDAVKLVTPPATGLAAEVATAVVGLARRLGLSVIAAGLETGAQWELVRDAGCRYGQGYLVSPPAPAERLEAYLAAACRVETGAAGHKPL